jgi:GNAT superfamily N-acetyltransferase
MRIQIDHLFQHPQHVRLAAGWIYDEFWTGQAGYSVETFEGLLKLARDPDRIPISLLALAGGEPAGTVNLIDNDDPKRPHLHPWLAALVVVPEYRRHGIGTALVRTLIGAAWRLGFDGLYLGTDIPPFYARLGAERHEQVTGSFCIMRFARRNGDEETTRGDG